MTISILMFCPNYRPLVGGAERQAEKLSHALVKKGYRVHVLTPQLVQNTPLREDDNGVIIERFPLFDLSRRFPFIRGLGLLNLYLINRQVKQVVAKRAEQFDVVHTHIASPLTAFAMQAALDLKIPVLCKAANSGERADLRVVKNNGIGSTKIYNQLKNKMQCWVATTNAVESGLLQYGAEQSRIVKIPNGVELPDLKKEPDSVSKDNTVKFLYLGRLSSKIQRDVPTMITAFDRLAFEYPNIELAIVGGGDLLNETKKLVAGITHSSKIKIPGIEDPEPWLKWADCFVLPSRNEGLSNALLEAMAHGLACIANDIPPNREGLDDGNAGLLTPIGDVDDLYNKMQLFASEPDQIIHWSKLARERVVNKYSIDSVATQYIELYKQLISCN